MRSLSDISVRTNQNSSRESGELEVPLHGIREAGFSHEAEQLAGRSESKRIGRIRIQRRGFDEALDDVREQAERDFTRVTLDEATRLIREEPPTRISSVDR